MGNDNFSFSNSKICMWTWILYTLPSVWLNPHIADQSNPFPRDWAAYTHTPEGDYLFVEAESYHTCISMNEIDFPEIGKNSVLTKGLTFKVWIIFIWR